MEEPRGVATSGAVAEVELHLPDVETGLQRLDRHPRLDAEAGCDREHCRTRGRRERPLTRERLAHDASAAELDQGPCDALREPDPAAQPAREGRDRHVCPGPDERTEIAVEVGVAEEQRPLGALALGQGERLPLPPPREPDDAGARSLGGRGGPVSRAVVGDDDLGGGERLSQRGDCATDPFPLVARCDEDRQRAAHSSPAAVTGGGSGSTPSVAPSSIP
jgi:hypothetical protein